MTIPEAALKAADRAIADAVGHTSSISTVMLASAALAAALPHLGWKVKKLEWGNARITEDGREAEDAESPVGRYIATDTGWFLLGRTGYEVERGLHQAKASAQSDYEARILSALEPSAAREQALEEAARKAQKAIAAILMSGGLESDKWWDDIVSAQQSLAAAIRALSSPDHADAGKSVEGLKWERVVGDVEVSGPYKIDRMRPWYPGKSKKYWVTVANGFAGATTIGTRLKSLEEAKAVAQAHFEALASASEGAE